MSDFVAGDVVALNSGGSEMTVTHVDRGVVYLAWHTEDRQLQMANLPEVALAAIRTANLPRRFNDPDDDIPF